MNITIIDYGAGNLRSVHNAISKLGYAVKISSARDDIAAADVVILPGVGAAADTVSALEKRELAGPIKEYIAADRPFLGICIGLQVLFTTTEEGGGHPCLDIIPGQVVRFPAGLKIPHMGWNQVKQKKAHPVFTGIDDETNFYFVHSYYVNPDDKSLVAGETEYDITFASLIARGNLVATQFHPEKSGDPGLKVYDNFFSLVAAPYSKKATAGNK